jgi:hypothetical protein
MVWKKSSTKLVRDLRCLIGTFFETPVDTSDRQSDTYWRMRVQMFWAIHTYMSSIMYARARPHQLCRILLHGQVVLHRHLHPGISLPHQRHPSLPLDRPQKKIQQLCMHVSDSHDALSPAMLHAQTVLQSSATLPCSSHDAKTRVANGPEDGWTWLLQSQATNFTHLHSYVPNQKCSLGEISGAKLTIGVEPASPTICPSSIPA